MDFKLDNELVYLKEDNVTIDNEIQLNTMDIKARKQALTGTILLSRLD
jgi:hypothetical protein